MTKKKKDIVIWQLFFQITNCISSKAKENKFDKGLKGSYNRMYLN